MKCAQCGFVSRPMRTVSGAIPTELLDEVKGKFPNKTNSELIRLAFESLNKSRKAGTK